MYKRYKHGHHLIKNDNVSFQEIPLFFSFSSQWVIPQPPGWKCKSESRLIAAGCWLHLLFFSSLSGNLVNSLPLASSMSVFNPVLWICFTESCTSSSRTYSLAGLCVSHDFIHTLIHRDGNGTSGENAVLNVNVKPLECSNGSKKKESQSNMYIPCERFLCAFPIFSLCHS